MGESIRKMGRTEKIGWIVTLVLTLACLVVPEQGIYTLTFKKFLAITVFCLSLAAFELVPNIMIAILFPALYLFTKCAPAQVILSPWLGTTAIMLMGIFFMVATLNASGLLRRIAFKMMCLANGSYLKILMMVFFVGVVLNIATSGNSSIIMAAICLGLCISLNEVKGRIGAGLASAVMIGCCTSHAYTFQAAVWGVINQMAEGYVDTVTPFPMMMHTWPLFIVSIVMVCVAYKMFSLNDDQKAMFENVTYFKDELNKMGHITRREKVNLIMLLAILVYMFTTPLHGMDLNLGFALIPWIVYLPFVNGADHNTLKSVQWDMPFFIMACMGIGTVAGSLGMSDAITTVCMNLLGDSTSVFSVLSIVFFIVFGLNFLMTPLAIIALITQPLIGIAASIGISPLPFLYAVNACSEAILLPYEYVPYLVVYGFGMISMKDFIKFNFVRSIIFFGGFLLLLVPYWMLIGLFNV